MQCTHCALWELAPGDLVCSWCGASYLRFTTTLEPADLRSEDYPPPVQLHIRNTSPMSPIGLEAVQASERWINLLPDQPLPQSLAPGAEHTLLLDVDTFAAAGTEATLTVTARYAPQPEAVTLRLVQPERAGS